MPTSFHFPSSGIEPCNVSTSPALTFDSDIEGVGAVGVTVGGGRGGRSELQFRSASNRNQKRDGHLLRGVQL